MAEDKPKPYRLGPEPGGRVPDVGQLVSATIAEFSDNLGPYALAGVGHFLVVLPVTFGAIFVVYFGMFAVAFGGMIGSAAVGAGVGGDAGDALAGVGMLLTFASTFAVIGALVLGIAGLLAPFSASLHRAVAEHQRGGKKLDIGAAFGSLMTDLVPVILVGMLYSTVMIFGILLCYLPGLVAMVVFGFAPALVYLHRRGAVSAMSTALAHCMANSQFYLMFGVLYFVVMMVAAYVPVLGPMFGMALHVRAYRELFGDGEEPVLEASPG